MNVSACVQTLDIPGELKAGYSPIGFVRCGRSACRVTKIDWKVCLPLNSPMPKPSYDARRYEVTQPVEHYLPVADV